MTNNDFAPAAMMALSDAEKIRAYVHPTRMTILELLAREKQSVSGVARVLGVHPANLTHHFKLLEKSGLIKLVEKRDTGKNLEKLYRSVARGFTVSTRDESPANKKVLALSILHDNLTAAIQDQRSRDDDSPVIGYLRGMRLRLEDVAKFNAKLARLLEEFGARRPKDGSDYVVNVSLYPGEPEQGSGKEIRIDAKP